MYTHAEVDCQELLTLSVLPVIGSLDVLVVLVGVKLGKPINFYLLGIIVS